MKCLQAMRDVPALLEDDLRIELAALSTFRLSMVKEISSRYQRKNVTAFARWLEKNQTSISPTA